MACPACIIPIGAVAASAGAALGLPEDDWRARAGFPTLGGLLCFGAVRLKNGSWKLGGCPRVRMAAGVGVSLLAVGGLAFFNRPQSDKTERA